MRHSIVVHRPDGATFPPPRPLTCSPGDGRMSEPEGASAQPGAGSPIVRKCWLSRSVCCPPRAGSTHSARREERAMNVVICDDHLLFGESLAIVLEARGHTVVACTAEPAAAVEAVKRHDVDACLMDLNFPNASGFDGIREVL